MLILAFETSAKACSVALTDGDKLLGESYQNTGITHSETMLPMARGLLQSCGFAVQDVTAVAVAAGPGSFTGVRIGVAAAKGFAWGGKIPAYGVSTLEAMALHRGIHQGTVCAVMDARRQQVYNALFAVKNGEYTRICGDRAIALSDLAVELQAIDGPVYLVGDGSKLCYDTLSSQIPNLVMPPEHLAHQRAAGVAMAAKQAMARGEDGDAAALTPNYLRLSQAERERLEKEKGER